MATPAIPTLEALEMSDQTERISDGRLWVGRILGTLAVLFLLLDGGLKLFKPPFVVQATAQLGYPESTIVGIGITLLISTAFYVIPRTSLLGAILLTAYLGAAVASNVRAGTPVFNTVFPILFATLIWASLVLRNKRLERVLFTGQ